MILIIAIRFGNNLDTREGNKPSAARHPPRTITGFIKITHSLPSLLNHPPLPLKPPTGHIFTSKMTSTMTTSPSSTNPLLPLQDAAVSPSAPTEQDNYNTQIDALLTRYLLFLDEYTTLRSSLSSLQAGMYQNLARANFTAERGVRYGKEYFDERMVASRRVVVRVGAGKEKGKGQGKGDKKEEEEEEEEHGGWWCEDEGEQRVEVGVVEVDEVEVVIEKEEKKDEERGEDVKQGDKKTAKKEPEEVVGQDKEAKEEVIQRADTATTATTTPPVASVDQDSGTLSSPNDDNDTPEADKEDETKKKIRKNDPLRWFGLLTPLPLRLAQTQAIQAVEQIIPRLVTVNAEMAQVEIEVRRARKRREKAAVKAKAAAAAAKDAK